MLTVMDAGAKIFQPGFHADYGLCLHLP